MTVAQCLQKVRDSYTAWKDLLASVPFSQYEEPLPGSHWSIKDIIAHITWHEDQMVEVMETRAFIGSAWWQLPTDERNRNIYKEYKSIPLQDILDDATGTHQQLEFWIETLSDDELNGSGQFEEMPPDWLFGDILAQNTYQHYDDHAKSLREAFPNLEDVST